MTAHAGVTAVVRIGYYCQPSRRCKVSAYRCLQSDAETDSSLLACQSRRTNCTSNRRCACSLLSRLHAKHYQQHFYRLTARMGSWNDTKIHRST